MKKDYQPQSRLTGAMVVTMAQALVLILGYATHLWIGRVLGPAPYGIYGVVLSIQSIFGLVLSLGVPAAISRFVARDHDHARSILRQAVRLQIYVALAIVIIILGTAPLVSRLLGDLSLIPLIWFVALVIFVQSLYPMYVQFFSGMHLFSRQALLTAIYAIIKLAGALVLIYFIGVYGAFAGFALGGIIAAVIGWYWTQRVGGSGEKKLSLKKFMAFAGTYTLTLVGLQVLISLDLFMVKALLRDNVQTGYYNAAVTLSRIPYLLLQAIGFILLPSVSKLTSSRESRQAAVTFIAETIRYLIMLIVPGVALASATSKPLLILFFSREYIPAAPSLTILMIGLGALAFYLLLANIVAGAGKAKVALVITCILIISSATFGWFLIPSKGLLGASLQTTISGLIGLSLLSYYTFKSFAIPLPLRSTINILAASAFAVAPTYIWIASPLTLIPQYLLSGCIYIVVLLALQEITPKDRTYIASLHPSLRWITAK